MKPIHFILLLASLTLGCWSTSAQSVEQESPPTDEEIEAMTQEFLGRLRSQEGTISLSNGVATLNLPAGFKYLNGQDSSSVLEELWGNPPGNEPLGMIVPTHVSLADAASCAILITFDQDGTQTPLGQGASGRAVLHPYGASSFRPPKVDHPFL